MDERTDALKPHSMPARFFLWFFSWRTLRRTLIGVAGLITLIALFCTEENWRGKRAWENCKHELEAKGVVLDWNAYIPPAVPDDQNAFKAPRMKEWFEGRGTTDFSQRLNSWNCSEFLALRGSGSIADVIIVTPGADITPGEADVVLKYKAPLLTLDSAPEHESPSPATTEANAGKRVRMTPAVREKLQPLIQNAIREYKHRFHGRYLKSPVGTRLFASTPAPFKPVRIVVRSKTVPTKREIAEFLPGHGLAPPDLGVAAAGSRTFRVFPSSQTDCAAADYVAWTDQFESDFDLVRKALKRPYARMDGDYQIPFEQPIPNFVCLRRVAQVLAGRTQSFLLLGQPEKALRDLTLIRDMCRLLEGHPQSKSTTLVAAMINVAITGLYTDTIADGLRLHAWGEPQLAAIEGKLAKINLLSALTEGIQVERAGATDLLQRSLRTPSANTPVSLGKRPARWWEGLMNRNHVFHWPILRGWIYQNLVHLCMIDQEYVQGLAADKVLVFPTRICAANAEIKVSHPELRPYWYMAAIMSPNLLRAAQVVAQKQTEANEALIACTLERYRLAHGEYPKSIETLKPQFLQNIPHDLIGGQPLRYHRVEDGSSQSRQGSAGGGYVLYSIGWNETDDGGQAVLDKSGRPSLDKGDWVWSP